MSQAMQMGISLPDMAQNRPAYVPQHGEQPQLQQQPQGICSFNVNRRYSGTCVVRPPFGSSSFGRKLQVVIKLKLILR